MSTAVKGSDAGKRKHTREHERRRSDAAALCKTTYHCCHYYS